MVRRNFHPTNSSQCFCIILCSKTHKKIEFLVLPNPKYSLFLRVFSQRSTLGGHFFFFWNFLLVVLIKFIGLVKFNPHPSTSSNFSKHLKSYIFNAIFGPRFHSINIFKIYCQTKIVRKVRASKKSCSQDFFFFFFF